VIDKEDRHTVITLMGGPLLSRVIETKAVESYHEALEVIEEVKRWKSPLTEFRNN